MRTRVNLFDSKFIRKWIISIKEASLLEFLLKAMTNVPKWNYKTSSNWKYESDLKAEIYSGISKRTSILTLTTTQWLLLYYFSTKVNWLEELKALWIDENLWTVDSLFNTADFCYCQAASYIQSVIRSVEIIRNLNCEFPLIFSFSNQKPTLLCRSPTTSSPRPMWIWTGSSFTSNLFPQSYATTSKTSWTTGWNSSSTRGTTRPSQNAYWVSWRAKPISCRSPTCTRSLEKKFCRSSDRTATIRRSFWK